MDTEKKQLLEELKGMEFKMVLFIKEGQEELDEMEETASGSPVLAESLERLKENQRKNQNRLRKLSEAIALLEGDQEIDEQQMQLLRAFRSDVLH